MSAEPSKKRQRTMSYGNTVSYEQFADSYLPLLNGPMVKVKLRDRTYEVSKGLLCKKSPYFHAMFNGNFKEGEEQSTELKEVEGVVSPLGFKLFLQWLYTRQIAFGNNETRGDRISAMVELARFGDMTGIKELESEVAKHIKAIVQESPWSYIPDDANTEHMIAQHLSSATRLPEGHSVRLLFAKAAVRGFLSIRNFRFLKETREIPGFGADLLEELRTCFRDFDKGLTDPFNGGKFKPGQP